MKQLLTVMAIMLFAGLTQGFTVPYNTSTINANGHGALKNNSKWRHTAWVNPWSEVKAFRASRTPVTDVPVNFHFIASNSPTFNKVAFAVDANQVFLNGVGGSYYYTGNYSFHIEVDLPPCCAPAPFILDIWDYVDGTPFGSQLFFMDTEYYVNQTFYIQPGHTYEIQLRVD